MLSLSLPRSLSLIPSLFQACMVGVWWLKTSEGCWETRQANISKSPAPIRWTQQFEKQDFNAALQGFNEVPSKDKASATPFEAKDYRQPGRCQIGRQVNSALPWCHTFRQSLKKFFLKMSFVVYSWSSIFAKNVATSSALGLSFITLPTTTSATDQQGRMKWQHPSDNQPLTSLLLLPQSERIQEHPYGQRWPSVNIQCTARRMTQKQGIAYPCVSR